MLVIFLPPSSPIFICYLPICQAPWYSRSDRAWVALHVHRQWRQTRSPPQHFIFHSRKHLRQFLRQALGIYVFGNSRCLFRPFWTNFKFLCPSSCYFYLFVSSSLSNAALDQLINDLSFANCLLRELVSFHQFKGLGTPELLSSVLFSAADFLSVLLLVKLFETFLPCFNWNKLLKIQPFRPALSLITELEQPISDSEDVQDVVDAHLLRQHELDLEEQNAQDVESFNAHISGSGYNGLFWHDIEPWVRFRFFQFSMCYGIVMVFIDWSNVLFERTVHLFSRCDFQLNKMIFVSCPIDTLELHLFISRAIVNLKQFDSTNVECTHRG